jgi:uncharacterized protein (TIGR02594 family)
MRISIIYIEVPKITKIFLCIFVIFLSPLAAFSFDQGDSGEYMPIRVDNGQPMERGFRIIGVNNQWLFEEQMEDGSFVKRSCTGECEFRKSTTKDVEKMFVRGEFAKIENVDCIQNNAFALCSFIFIRDKKTGYVMVGFTKEGPFPIPLRLIQRIQATSDQPSQPGESSRTFIPQADPNSDEANWASSFVNYGFEKAHIQGTRDRRALSWLKWGVPLKKPAVGCVAVIDYGGGRGHVGFVEGVYQNMIVLLGGNQSNQVNLTAFSAEDITAYRWPKGWPLDTSVYVLPEVRPDGAPPRDEAVAPPGGVRLPDRHHSGKTDIKTAEYQSVDRTQYLKVEKLGDEKVRFEIRVVGRCTRVVSGVAYEIYPEDMEIDAEVGVGYPVREYFFWDDSEGARGLAVRLSARGAPRARVNEWGYQDPCSFSEAIMHENMSPSTK